MNSMPFPSNDDRQPVFSRTTETKEFPWKKLHPNEQMPMCFEVRFQDGSVETFPYSDFRGTKLLHAGYLIVNIYGMEKYQIVIEGRHLGEFAKHLSLGRIHWFGESPVLGHEPNETLPHIQNITIEAL